MESADKTKVFDVVINRRSGTVLRVGEEQIRKDLTETFGDRTGNIMFVDGKDIAATVKALAAEQGSGRGIIIGGGDGSVLTAAAEILGRDDITLGVLPLGTHNLFARQLGFAADFKKAAAQYKTSEPEKVDVGNINGLYFLCGLALDRDSVRFYEAREDVRDSKKLSALKKGFAAVGGVMGGKRSTLHVSTDGPQGDGRLHKGRLFAVTNNALTPKSSKGKKLKIKGVVENIFAKEGQNDGKLGFYAVSGKPWRLMKVLPKIWDGTWTQSKVVSVEVAPELFITPAAKKDAGKEISIVLDGEIKKTQFPLDIKIIPQGLRVYKPK